MSSVEEKLAAYRARKRQESSPPTRKIEEPSNTSNPGTRNLWHFFGTKTGHPLDVSPEERRPLTSDPEEDEVHEYHEVEDNRPNTKEHLSDGRTPADIQHTTSRKSNTSDKYLEIATIVLKFLLWAGLMTIFVKIQFGAVFFIISVFYFIFTNLRNRPKQEGEPSAYSVFNPNCEPIDGTTNAEDMQRQLLFMG
jgi:hypothetical protein